MGGECRSVLTEIEGQENCAGFGGFVFFLVPLGVDGGSIERSAVALSFSQVCHQQKCAPLEKIPSEA